MTKHCLAALLLLACPLAAAERDYFNDTLTSLDRSRWIAAGNLAPGREGLAAPDERGGSLIWASASPDGTSDAEVHMTIALTASGGHYTQYLRATADGRGGQGPGNYLALEMQNPTFDSEGHCSATFALLENIGGVVTLLSSFPHACRNGMEMRFAIRGSVALVWPDQADPMEFATSAPAVGQPGIGARGTPSGNAISAVRLSLVNHVAPAAVDEKTIGISAFRTRVDIQWAPAADGPNADGPVRYWVYRDGDYLMRTAATHVSDEAVSAGSQHTYAIYTVDQHDNFSQPVSLTASTPAPVSGANTPPPVPAHGK
jgi:hypothetical protein